MLKEAQKEIIEDLKSAIFKKKPKKHESTKEKSKVTDNYHIPADHRRYSPSATRKPFLSDLSPHLRPTLVKQEKARDESLRRKLPTEVYKYSNTNGNYFNKELERFRYNSGPAVQQHSKFPTELSISEINPDPADKNHRPKFEEPTF